MPLGPAAERVAFAPGLVMPVGRGVFPAGAKVGAVFSPEHRYTVVSAFLGQIPENQWQWEDDRRVPGRRVLVPVNPKKPPPLILHDLSSGTRVGQFPGTVPLSLTNRQIGGMGTVRPLLVKPRPTNFPPGCLLGDFFTRWFFGDLEVPILSSLK